MGLMKYISEQFHKPTGFGSRLATFVMNRQNDKQYRGTEAALALRDTDTVLDIGFGNGYLLHRLAECYGCRFYGIDISEDMLRAASKRCEQFINKGRMTLSLGDALQTELPDNFFDKVYTVNTVYFWDDLAAGLAEIRRVLKSGATFINAVYTREFLDTLPVTSQGYAKHSIGHLVTTGETEGFTVTPQAIVEGKAYCLVYQKQGERLWKR
jgi:ubiquinone/menaquinone biosynthesis C-methylase UbiE